MKLDPWRIAEDPAADEAAAALLRTATPSCHPGPLPGEEEALAEFRATGHDLRRPLVQTTRRRARILIATAATAGMLTCTGAAAAATGDLPDAAQQTARDMLAKVGVTVPGPSLHSPGHADTRGTAHPANATPPGTSAEDTSPESTPSTQASPSGKGAEVSNVARTTTATGVAKGAQISTLASDGKSQAGQHGTPSTPGSQGTAHKPSTPGSQGTAHKPSGAGATGGGTSDSHRP